MAKAIPLHEFHAEEIRRIKSVLGKHISWSARDLGIEAASQLLDELSGHDKKEAQGDA